MQIEEDSFWFKHRNNVIAESVKKYSPGKHFLDIGGGNGFVSTQLQKEGIKTALLEPGLTGAKNAKERGVQQVICSTFQNAGFKKSSIDSIGLFDVIEHIENDHDFLNLVNYCLEPGGFVYITVPAYDFLWSGQDNVAGHFRRYTLNSLQDLLERCDLQVKYSTYFFSILLLPIFLFRTIPSIFKINKISTDTNTQGSEHKIDQNSLKVIFEKIFDWELNRVKNSKKIPFGSSCFVVAKKPCKKN